MVEVGAKKNVLSFQTTKETPAKLAESVAAIVVWIAWKNIWWSMGCGTVYPLRALHFPADLSNLSKVMLCLPRHIPAG